MPRKAATPPKSKTVPPQPATQDAAEVSAAGIRKEIAKAAYQRAERRGFAPGHEVEDWLAAEAQVKTRLGLTGKPN